MVNTMYPSGKSERLTVIDALRGLALFGILVANIPVAADLEKVYAARDLGGWWRQCDNISELLNDIFISKKFITIFSMLFGFGFYIQMEKASKAGVHFQSYFLKRMLLLFLIGCIHAYIFWFGDIIRDYAICGIFLLLVYRWPAKRIFILAILFNIVITGLVFITNGVLDLQQYNYDTTIITELPVTESYLRYLQINATIDPLLNFVQDSPITLSFCFGNMLIGLLLAKTGFFSNITRSGPLMKRFIWAGAIFGLLASYIFILVNNGTIKMSVQLVWLPFLIIMGMLLQSLFYISAFTRLFVFTGARKLLSVFEPVGRMALSNYLLQTCFYITVFYHWANGLQLYGKLTLTETYIVAAVLFSMQVWLSRWWLSKHKQGPVEYAWKKLSYPGRYKKQPAVVAENV